jgi:uncharacterized integral membrane protein
MKIRALILAIPLGLLLIFTLANWGAITTPTPISLLVGRIDAPLGLILLMFLVVVTVVFLLLMVAQQATVIVETRRAAKELTAQRVLADQAEASRFTELRRHLDVRLDRVHEEMRSPEDAVNARIDRLEAALREAIEHTGNTLAAYIGEVDDRVERLGNSCTGRPGGAGHPSGAGHPGGPGPAKNGPSAANAAPRPVAQGAPVDGSARPR